MFTDFFGATPRAKILDHLADHPASDFTLTDIARGSHVARPTVYKEIDALAALAMVRQTRRIGQSRLFQINIDHPVVRDILTTDLEQARADLLTVA